MNMPAIKTEPVSAVAAPKTAPVATPAPLPQPPTTGGGGPSPFPLPLFGLLGLLLLCGASVVAWRAFDNASEMPQRER